MQMVETSPKWCSELPTQYEHNVYEEIWSHFEQERQTRKANGTFWPGILGEIMTIRRLRLTEKLSMEECIEANRNTLKCLEEFKLDDKMAALTKIYEGIAAEDRLVMSEDIPLYKEFAAEYVPHVWNSPELTPDGDCVFYIPVIDANPWAIMDKGLFHQFQEYLINAFMLRQIEIEALCRKQGRMVNLVFVADMYQKSADSCREFDKAFMALQLRINPVFTLVAKDIFTINMKWYLEKMANATKKDTSGGDILKYLQNDGSDDPDIVRVIKPEELKRLQSTRVGLEKEIIESDGSTRIGANSLLEKAVQVEKGQKVAWQFSIVPGSWELPSPELEFSVAAVFVTDDEEQQGAADLQIRDEEVTKSAYHQMMEGKMSPEQMVDAILARDDIVPIAVEPDVYNSLDEEVTGDLVAEGRGCILLRWSNSGSLRTKNLFYSIS